ncbi:TetR/AcrR family transcriptional regulator [Streptomyces sp. BE230]|uniref:TetR/AcrR family transcriptional regulator n=1 Tax=Streptomyces sp. BE230 TaxID=3002526 RepID=UPI002ED5CD07|nr:TetR/AcrR family transcriptional regulator [Streptomyces sp. BE230]
MPTLTWQRLDPTRRERILAAAMDEFGGSGYSAGSLNTVAREAGVAKGSLFQYFDDKLDLFSYVAGVAAENVREALAPWLGTIPEDGTYYEFLCDGLLAWTRYFASHPRERGLVAATHLEIDPQVRAAVHEPARRLYAAEVATLAEQAVRRGDFRPDADPEAFAAFLSLLLPHLAVAPSEPGFDTLVPLYGLSGTERDAQVIRLVTAVYAGFGTPGSTDSATG